MQLKELYDGNGNKRMYREDENGKLFVFCKDKKEKLIIRDFFEEDALNWVNAMKDTMKLTAKQKNSYMSMFRDIVRKRKEEDSEFTLVVTTNTGKLLGTIDVMPAGDEYNLEAKVKISLRNDRVIEQSGESVIRAIINLVKNYNWYDKIYLVDEAGHCEELLTAS